MRLSAEDNFSEAQVITLDQNAVTYSTSVLVSKHGDDLDKKLRLFLQNSQAAVGAGASVTVALQTSADNVTFTTLRTFDAFAVAALTAGVMLLNGIPLPDGLKKYLRLSYTVSGAALTTSPKFTGGLTPDYEVA